MAVRYEDVAVRCGDHVARLVESIGRAGTDAGLAQPHEDFPVGAEFEDLHADSFFLVGKSVSQPDVAVMIHVKPVREHHRATAEAFQQLACLAVELEDRIQVRSLAGIGAAPFVGPDLPVGPRFHTGRHAPRPAGGELAPPLDDGGVGIRQFLADDLALRMGHRSA